MRKSLFVHPEVHEAGAPILQVAGLTVLYNGHHALADVTFHLKSGERLAVVGPNGAGKSTLFKVISGVLPPTSGEVKIAGRSPGRHICIAYVPQRTQVDWNFPVTVAAAVMMGRYGRIGLLRRPHRRDWDYVRDCLDVVSMTELAERQIGELSGGQQQRMFIARALAQEAELMLMDEPLTGLDVPAQDDIFRVLETLQSRGVTVMVATHDLHQAAERFDRVMLLRHRLVGLGLPNEVFTTENLQFAYGGQLHLIQSKDGVLALCDTCGVGDSA